MAEGCTRINERTQVAYGGAGRSHASPAAAACFASAVRQPTAPDLIRGFSPERMS